MDYKNFISNKKIRHEKTGFDPIELPINLFPFQNDICRWACLKGRAAVFADCLHGQKWR